VELPDGFWSGVQHEAASSGRMANDSNCFFIRVKDIFISNCRFFKGLVFVQLFGDSRFMELVFSVTQEGDGGYVAECLSHDIFTQGNSWDELRANVREAVSAYFFDQPKPGAVRLHLVRDELLAGA